jgi:hypothetical protein
MGGSNFSCFLLFHQQKNTTNYFRIDSFMGEKRRFRAVEAADAAYNNGRFVANNE